jgi:hypothetical protein
LKNLPPLEPTKIIEPDLITYQRKDGSPVTFSADYGGSDKNKKHRKRRSLFFPGVAAAMANQWGRFG